MKIHPLKKLTIVLMFIPLSIIFVCTFLINDLSIKSVKTQLMHFYNSEFSNCKIVEIVRRHYPGSSLYSYYDLFSVDCVSGLFPILEKHGGETSLNKNQIVNKIKDSYEMTVNENGKLKVVTMRSAKEEIGPGIFVRFAVIFIFISYFIIQFFIPDHYYDLRK